jgi:predicted transcriptional regulator
MSHDQLIADLQSAAADLNHTDTLRRAQASRMRELIHEAHSAGVGATQIARAANLSRQSVYELLERPRPS